MEINFIEETERVMVQFLNVENNQFFIDGMGRLSQKKDEFSYTIIADEKGTPLADFVLKAKRSDRIIRILPKVTKINF